MEESYLKALQRQTSLPRNMKGVPVEVKTNIGLSQDVPPEIQQFFDMQLMRLKPELRAEFDKKVKPITRSSEAKAKQINKAFGRRALQNTKRNEEIERLKRQQMTAVKDAEIEAVEKGEKAKAKADAKAERKAEKQDAIYLDFPKLDLDESTYETSRSIIDGKMATLENKYSKKMELQPDGSKKLNNFDQKEFDNEKAELEAERSQLDNKYYATREYKLRLLFRDANRKYPGNPQKVYDVFANEGYEQEYIKYARELQSKQGSNK